MPTPKNFSCPLVSLLSLLIGCANSTPSIRFLPAEHFHSTTYRDVTRRFEIDLPAGWAAFPSRFEAFHYNIVFLTIDSKGINREIQTQPVSPNIFEYNDKVVYQQMQPGEAYIAIGDWEGPGPLPASPDSVGENLHSLLSANPLRPSSEAPLESLELNFSKGGHQWNIRAYLAKPISPENRAKVLAILNSFRFTNQSTASNPSAHPRGLPVVYYNPQYDFRFLLPEDWRGYSVLQEQWQDFSSRHDHGPIIVLRSPKWTINHPYQDIPILVFTREQWRINQGCNRPASGPVASSGKDHLAIIKENWVDSLEIFAGGVEYEISHNAKYVFACYSRFNANDEVPGWDEAQRTVDANMDAGKPHLPESPD